MLGSKQYERRGSLISPYAGPLAMKTTLLTVGIGCIIAAIVGGGLKAFGMEIPLVNSNKRQLLLGFFGLVLVAASLVLGESPPVRESVNSSQSNSVAPSRARPHLSYGTWTLRNAIDDEGGDFGNSTLKFTSQEETSDGLVLQGTFTWRLNNVLLGTEQFTGHYVDTSRQIIFDGFKVVMATSHPMTTGSYSAIVSPDERALVDGHWGVTMENEQAVKGRWEPTR